jgi:four helix bundle protein
MARKVNRFEDLVAWQKARAFAKDVVLTTKQGSLARDFSLRDQMVRAARSTMANIAEGFDRTGQREFHKGLSISKGSCAEVRSDLYLALDVGYIDQPTFERLMNSADETARVIEGLRAAVARRLAAQG